MIKDHIHLENKQKLIEVLVGDGETKMWLPAFATNLFLVNQDQEIQKVTEIRVRELEKE